MVIDKKVFSVEVQVTDQQKVKRRLVFSAGVPYQYSKDNIMKQPHHARVPCDFILEG